MPTPSQDRKSAAFYLRGNVMVGVDLDPSIPVSGKLPVPNQSLQRSAITPYGCPPAGQLDRRSSTSTGHHIEINLDTRELARLVLPVTIPGSTEAQLLSLGAALSFFLAEGHSRVGGPLGAIHTCLHDAGIKVHPFKGSSSLSAVP